MPSVTPIKRALISLSDKTGLVEFAKALSALNVDIISTGNTLKQLKAANVPVTHVKEVTGLPEMMDGRVKTLHPNIHGGILARRGTDDETLKQHEIQTIDLVVCNLYPFNQTIAKNNHTLEEAIENIDIGGPSMIRAAAKNFNDVGIVVSSDDYDRVIDALKTHLGLPYDLRCQLSKKAFAHTAAYDSAIANYLSGVFPSEESVAETITVPMAEGSLLRYGENPHQKASVYLDHANVASIANAKQLHGKALSFNNIADADTAFACIQQFPQELPHCVIVKHANPCGVARGATLNEAYLRAFKADPVSAFGGIIAFNQTLDALTCKTLLQEQFAEVIIAPDVDDDALSLLQAKPNLRVLTLNEPLTQTGVDIKRIHGGFLVQERDTKSVSKVELETVTQQKIDDETIDELMFAWTVAKFVKSNAVVYSKDFQTVGIGAGQTSRVASSKIGVMNALEFGHEIKGAVLASDAFFPFRDGVDAAAEAGVRAIIQPGGSIRDDEVIAACNEHNIASVFTRVRHFRH